MKRVLSLIVFLAVCSADTLVAQPLPRKAWMDIRTREMNDSLKQVTKAEKGLYVVSVGEKGTGFNLKMAPGDVLLKINGEEVSSPRELRDHVSLYREGDVIKAEVICKRKTRILSGIAAPSPRETSEDYEVLYDRVAFGEGFLSMIISKPEGEGPFPIVLFIPGYMCYSLDNIGAHPYGQITSRLTKAGYVVVRVDKSGEGASVNTPDCRSIGYWEEVRGFAAGLEKIYTLKFADTSNVFIFGHSLGAIQAPFVAKGFNVRGIMIEGTSGDTWFEYITDMFRFQNPIMGIDPAENEEMIMKSIPLLFRYLVMNENPDDLAQDPVYDTILRDMMQYDGAGHIWDRHYSYWQELQHVNQASAWRDTEAQVLVMRGSGDLEAFSNEQHEGIVRTINHYRPGAAKFVLIPDTDHAFCRSGTPEESYKNSKVKGYYYSNFNDEVIRITDQWMREIMIDK